MDSNSNERRSHTRHKLICPITLFGRGGEVLVKTNTTDLSHGGTYVTVAQDRVQGAENINVAFSIPDTADRQIEGFAASARIIRLDRSDQAGQIGMALQFTEQMQLPIEA